MSSGTYSAADRYGFTVAAEVLTKNCFTPLRNWRDPVPFSVFPLGVTSRGFHGDPDGEVTLGTHMVSIAWPDGNVDGEKLQTLRVDRADGEPLTPTERQRRRTHEVIVNASLGNTALENSDVFLQVGWRIARAQAAENIYTLRSEGAPLAICQISSVLESDTIPSGTNVAHLWHPEVLAPDQALAIIQDSVRQAS